ncbi:cardiolipin synthase (CMP-forming)-like isoform X1 [Corticium candelabrum]|uniref:cardiolipin synthase (CMP-forming)-like isoform X1 n=1 Tax=Corticium candelabrum TaxID=121492 RepID=UPI002E272946|nr:cardiolipin synthase (CMP-forming)-like isoform X1 [Corticium candelabrum]
MASLCCLYHRRFFLLHGISSVSMRLCARVKSQGTLCNMEFTRRLKRQHVQSYLAISIQHRQTNTLHYRSKSSRSLRYRVEDIGTVPNLLSAIRLCLAPFIGYLVINHGYSSALVLFTAAGVTDWLDGYIARNFKNQRSIFGTLLDPLADKILISSLAISLAYVGIIPVPLTALFLIRDVGLITASVLVRYQSLPPPKTFRQFWNVRYATTEIKPTVIGKINTVLQLGLVMSSLAAPLVDMVNHPLLQMMWYLTATTTVASAVSYMVSKDAVKILKHRQQ